MKKFIFSLLVALLATTSIQAQQISVVSSEGVTTLHRTLQDAIMGASPGSVIYLPGGAFTIADSVKITKKLTIIGIGHFVNGDNVDGITTIGGNLWFNEGSSGSAIMGCHIIGNVNIGEGGAEVNDMLIRFCNLNSVQVKNSSCKDITINQNYIRNQSSFSGANTIITNNVIHSIFQANGATITHNIIIGEGGYWTSGGTYLKFNIYADNSIISYNVLSMGTYSGSNSYYNNVQGGGNTGTHNIVKVNFGENCINIGNTSWNDVFEKNAGINTSSNFHFKGDYVQYEDTCGIYAGTGFNDQQMAPVPYIVAKKIDEQTDSQGKLKVRIRVKANQ